MIEWISEWRKLQWIIYWIDWLSELAKEVNQWINEEVEQLFIKSIKQMDKLTQIHYTMNVYKFDSINNIL